MIGRVNVGGGGEVGPTYTIKKWCATVGYDYANLDDIPETAMRQLMTKYASVAYFLEWYSADNSMIDAFIANQYAMKWIGHRDYICDKLLAITDFKTKALASEYWEYILKDHVPVMTSDSAPYGSCSASSTYSGYNAYKAFDNDSSTSWVSYDETQPSIIYNFTNPTKINAISEIPYYSSYFRVKGFTVSGSNDGNTWTPIYSGVSAESNTEQFFKFANENYYMMCKVQITSEYASLSSSGKGFTKLQFYGRSLNVSVPTMTSDTSPYGEVIASTVLSSTYDKYKAFDNLTETEWATSVDHYTNQYIGYDFKYPVAVYMFYITNTPQTGVEYAVKDFKLQGYNGTTWKDIQSYTNPTASPGKTTFFLVDAPKEYEKYRIFGSSYGTVVMTVAELNFYGVDYSERTDRTYLYDHGLKNTSLIGDFKASHSQDLSLGTYNEDGKRIYAKISDSSSPIEGVSLFTESKIDFTTYTKLFGNIKEARRGSKELLNLCVSTVVDHSTYVSNTNEGNVSLVAGKLAFLDVTNMNDSYNVLIELGHVSGIDGITYVNIDELWLE